MAISAQQTKIHVAIATWEWGSYFDPKLKINGIRLNISNWRRCHGRARFWSAGWALLRYNPRHGSGCSWSNGYGQGLDKAFEIINETIEKYKKGDIDDE